MTLVFGKWGRGNALFGERNGCLSGGRLFSLLAGGNHGDDVDDDDDDGSSPASADGAEHCAKIDIVSDRAGSCVNTEQGSIEYVKAFGGHLDRQYLGT